MTRLSPRQLATLPARAILDRSMSEDELYIAVTDALTATGWRWTHVGRSDLALMDGAPGLPDIIAARDRVLVLELKRHGGRFRPGQEAWLEAFRRAGADARSLRPEALSAFLEAIR